MSGAAKMFSRAQIPLSGGDFRARFNELSTQAKANYEQLDTFSQLLAPLKWEDQLSNSQRLRFHSVATPAEWNGVALTFRLALQKVPVLSFASVAVDEELRYVSLGVYDAHVAVFSVAALKQVDVNWLKPFDVLPAEFKEWLCDPSIFVLVADDTVVPDESTGCVLNNVVSTERIYMLYQSKMVIRPVVHTADGRLAKQMAYTYCYTHQPCTPEYFRHLVGEHQYRRWPDHRQPGWRPKSTFDLKVREEFYLFYETVGALAFVYQLLRHGVVFGDLGAVAPTLPLDQMMVTFLRGAGQPELALATDPLALYSDAATESAPPPAAEEHETLELTDRVLEDEFRCEGDGRVPAGHPGYFTREGGRTSAAAETAGAPGARPPIAAQVGTEDVVGRDGQPGKVSTATASPEGGPGAGEEGAGVRGERPLSPASGGRRRRRRGGPPSPPRKRHASWPQTPRPPGPRPWNVDVVPPSGPVPAPWAIDLRSQLTLPSNNNVGAMSRLEAAVAVAQGFPAYVPEASASVTYDSAQDLRARLDVRRGVAALAGEAQDEALATDLPLDYNLCFAQRSLRAARRGDAAASEGQFTSPEEEGDGEAGFPSIERSPSNLFLTAAERAFNPFAERPVFHGRCGFCSGNHCSRQNQAGTGTNCRKMRQHLRYTPTRRICLYRRCKTPTDHHTSVCAEMHRRCACCGCRGHGPEDACDVGSPVVMSRLRVDFEEYAGLGLYTRHRFTRLEWGFYPVPSTIPRQPVVSYVRLTNMRVLEAIQLVADLTGLPQNQVAAVPEVLPPADAPLGRTRVACSALGGGSEELADEGESSP